MSRLPQFLYFLIAILVVVLVVIVGTHDPSQMENPPFTKFYYADLNGKLTSLVAYRSIDIKVGTSKEKYRFNPRTDDRLNDGKHFHLFAEVGDSVRKPAQSDTLYLLKNGQTYRYLFSTFKK